MKRSVLYMLELVKGRFQLYQIRTPVSRFHTLCPIYQPRFSELNFLSQDSPYRAKTLGSVPKASRSMIGMCGLFFFMVGYALVRNVLHRFFFETQLSL